MPCRALLSAALLAGLAGGPAAAQVKISCYRGPLPQSALINGPNDSFVRSIAATYAVTADEARDLAETICDDLAAVDDPDRLLALTRETLKGLKRR